ncbi:hypothetical protein JCM10207_007164 [Rhodosporidiobolus poonsookiae]
MPRLVSASSAVFLLLLLTRSDLALAKNRKITVANKCDYTIWPGLFTSVGPKPSQATGWEAAAGSSIEFEVEETWGGRIWPRTNCDFTSDQPDYAQCETGGCKGGLECDPDAGTGVLPCTLAFNIQENVDNYDTSNVDNVPLAITNSASCPLSNCPYDLNTICPDELQYKNDAGEVVGCLTDCGADGSNEEYCCSGAHSTPATCPSSAIPNYGWWKKNCPIAYAYAYDESSETALFTCTDRVDYTITFCPTSDLFSTTATLQNGTVVTQGQDMGTAAPGTATGGGATGSGGGDTTATQTTADAAGTSGGGGSSGGGDASATKTAASTGTGGAGSSGSGGATGSSGGSGGSSTKASSSSGSTATGSTSGSGSSSSDSDTLLGMPTTTAYAVIALVLVLIIFGGVGLYFATRKKDKKHHHATATDSSSESSSDSEAGRKSHKSSKHKHSSTASSGSSSDSASGDEDQSLAKLDALGLLSRKAAAGSVYAAAARSPGGLAAVRGGARAGGGAQYTSFALGTGQYGASRESLSNGSRSSVERRRAFGH